MILLENLAAEQRRDAKNLGRSRIITIDHWRFERDGVRRSVPRLNEATEGVASTYPWLLSFCVYTRYGSAFHGGRSLSKPKGPQRDAFCG
jgi:hypothetical protein